MKTRNKYLRYSYCYEMITGSNHQFLNLFALLAEASVLGRIAVVPDLTLIGTHNNGKPVVTPPSTYLDLSACMSSVSIIGIEEFDGVKIDDHSSIAEDTLTEELKNDKSTLVVREFKRGVFIAPMTTDETVNQTFYRIRSLARPSKKILQHSNAIELALGSFNIVHVRRGDMLEMPWWRFPGLDRRTRPRAINLRISRWMDDGCNLYIMSDETKEGFFDLLNTRYRVFTYQDFPALVEIKARDNYLLYEIEKNLASKAYIRVEMFNEYPQYGKFKYCLFDYPRGGSTSLFYVSIGKIMNAIDRGKGRFKSIVRRVRGHLPHLRRAGTS